MQQLLRIKWSAETEYVAFDEDDHFPAKLETTGYWKNSQTVTYVCTAMLQKRSSARKLELIYTSKEQIDPQVKRGKIDYGKWIITWKEGEPAGQAHWKDENNTSFDREVAVDVLGGQKLVISQRTKRSVLVKQRPQQTEFRDALLALDKRCVITGEGCREALQAAHLIPVSQQGSEQIGNGILLRSDLHLLFDAGLFWFEVSADHAAVKYSPSTLTEGYERELQGRHLPKKTFGRVKAALIEQAKLPGGKHEVF